MTTDATLVALAEVRSAAAVGSHVGLPAEECAALAEHIDRLHAAVLAAEDRPEGWSATVADVAAEIRALGAVQQEIPAPRGFRVGDVVQITGRHDDESGPEALKLLGRIGAVAEIDDNPEYPIGLTVAGWVGLVWCNSTEIRHLTAEEIARLESGDQSIPAPAPTEAGERFNRERNQALAAHIDGGRDGEPR